MKRFMLTTTASVIFALALASVVFAAPPPGKGGGKSFGPAPHVIPTKPIHHAPGNLHGPNFGPAPRINANINLGPARVNVNLGPARVNVNLAPRYVNYHLTNGVRFNQGFYYRGRNHFHWSYQRWDPRYGCYLFYDPCVSMWYYWNQPMGCYYPVNYCPTGSYASPYANQPLANVPIYPNGNSEPIAPPVGPMPNGYPPMDGLPPIPAPMYP